VSFTTALTPPLAIALVLGFTWRSFSGRAAMLVMVGGSLLIGASFLWPELVTLLANEIDLDVGTKTYTYIRALYGLVVCAGLGLIGSLVWGPRAGRSNRPR